MAMDAIRAVSIHFTQTTVKPKDVTLNIIISYSHQTEIVDSQVVLLKGDLLPIFLWNVVAPLAETTN